MLKIVNLNHSFNQKTIFDQASITIPSDEKIWLRGENGSGKTTFFKILAGILHPSTTDGLELFWDDKKLSLSELKREVNFIPNTPYLFEYLSGKDNIDYLVSLFELKESYSAIMENMSALNMVDSLDLEVRTYSLGMKAKLYLGVMLERKTSIILIDEILNNIDTEASKTIVELLETKVSQDHASVVLSSHVGFPDEFPNLRQIYLSEKRFIHYD